MISLSGHSFISSGKGKQRKMYLIMFALRLSPREIVFDSQDDEIRLERDFVWDFFFDSPFKTS
jgi:hypothetical protein